MASRSHLIFKAVGLEFSIPTQIELDAEHQRIQRCVRWTYSNWNTEM